MKKYQKIIIALSLVLACPQPVSATSLDELYRDIVKSENRGYLPLFVKNRTIPDILIEEEVFKKIPESASEPLKSNLPQIKLSNNRAEKELRQKLYTEKWHQVLRAVQENRVTPVDLDEINKRVALNDPKAVEVFAWMNAKGVGVQTNLLEAFRLYQKAQTLNVPAAADNVRKVYKAMTPDQRARLKSKIE